MEQQGCVFFLGRAIMASVKISFYSAEKRSLKKRADRHSDTEDVTQFGAAEVQRRNQLLPAEFLPKPDSLAIAVSPSLAPDGLLP